MLDSRYSWVDTSKGIAIILVVIGHVIVGLRGAGIATGEAWGIVHNAIYSFHMPLFFMMSGFFVVRSIKSRSEITFLAGKIDTIVYPYILWMIIQAASLAVVGKYTNGNVDASWLDVIKLYPAKDQFWFLYHLMLMMLVTLIIFSAFRIPVLLATIMSLGMYFFLDGASVDIARFSAFYCYFIIGSLIGRDLSALQAFLSHRLVFVFTGLGFALAQYMMLVVLNVKHNEYGVFTLVVALISILFILSLSVQISNLGIGWLRVVGQASMLIFLGHILSGSGVRIFMQKLFGINEVWIHFSVGVLTGILPWLMIYVYSQRYHVLQYLYQLKYFSRVASKQ